MNRDESIIIDGKVFNKTIEKFYTEDVYETIKDTFKHCFIQPVKRDTEGKFRIGSHTCSWDKPANTIGYAVLDWYTPLPRNVRDAIDNLEKKPNLENAAMYLAAIKVAVKNPDNNLSHSMYPALMIRGHENCWGTDSAWAKIELWKNNDDGIPRFTACGQHGPGEYYDGYKMSQFCDEEDFENCFKVIEIAMRRTMNRANSFEVMAGDSQWTLSAEYNKMYKPNVVAYKSFCKTYAKTHPFEMLNTYTFYAHKVQKGYNPWHNSRTIKEAEVSFDIRAKTKKEAYEMFKERVASENERYGKMWYPGTEGNPHLTALPMSEGCVSFRPKKGEIYC